MQSNPEQEYAAAREICATADASARDAFDEARRTFLCAAYAYLRLVDTYEAADEIKSSAAVLLQIVALG